MFDGIDVVTLPAADIDRLRTLYVDGLGFTPGTEQATTGPAWQRILSLPAPPRRSLLLTKPGSQGGWIRLVEVPGLPAATPAGRPDRDGPFALDFYVRGADRVEARLAELGFGFRSEPAHYLLPGTDVPVRERMLVSPDSGLLHAVVEHRPGQTRCVLGSGDGDAPDHDASEVVAVVFFTHRPAEAAAFAEEALGARRYFTGRFDGEAVERMLALEPGEGFPASLFRGPASRNARLEFAETMPGAPGRTPDPVPRVVAGCAVDDLAELAARVADGGHGASTGVLVLPDGRRRLGLASRYGAAFEFWQRGE